MAKHDKTCKCPLCTIPLNEKLLYEDDEVYLVHTKDLKGHKVRVLVATKRHTANPNFREQVIADVVLVDYMNNLMRGQDWYIVDSTHATYPDHWHRVACDTPSEDESDPLFTKTPKVHFPLKEEKILIGIPAYNEEKTLPSVLEKATKYGDVIVVNDGSTDNTSMIAARGRAQVLIHDNNQGYGSSINELFHIAKQRNCDVLITLDADGQHNPSEIPNFLKELRTVDVVVGNRFKVKSDIPSYRRFGVKTISKLSGISDAQCGFRAYNKRAISAIANNIFERGMGASVEILKIAQNSNLKISEVPCTIRYANEKHSQNPLSHGVDVVQALFWAIIWRNPSKTLLPLGLFFMISSVISFIQIINLYVISHYIVLSWALFCVGSVICTILIFNILTFVFVFKNKKVSEE